MSVSNFASDDEERQNEEDNAASEIIEDLVARFQAEHENVLAEPGQQDEGRLEVQAQAPIAPKPLIPPALAHILSPEGRIRPGVKLTTQQHIMVLAIGVQAFGFALAQQRSQLHIQGNTIRQNAFVLQSAMQRIGALETVLQEAMERIIKLEKG